MRTLCYEIPIEYDGKQVQYYLRHRIHCSGTLLKLLKRQEQGILLNDSTCRTVDMLHFGDVLCINIPPGGSGHVCVPMPLEIVYEDEDVLVLNKPPFLSMHNSAGHHTDTLANGVAYYLQQKGMNTAFRAINRLDRDTSGLVLIGLHPYSAARLTMQVEKEYFAIVQGVYEEEGTIDLPIGRVDGSVILRQVRLDGQQAITHWKNLMCKQGLSFLRIQLQTGRTHQIRVHFSHFGTPVLGDTLYAKGDDRIVRQALHCGTLRFVHPITEQSVELHALLPADMVALLPNLIAAYPYSCTTE